jgi:hypothetical protein
MANQHPWLPVVGYHSQSDHNISLVNENKALEERVLRRLDALKDIADVDQRWLEMARSQIEQGFMAANRAVFQPGRVALDDDV